MLRQNLNVMHIEKNVFDNIMNTILNRLEKTKNNLKSRLDVADICVRSELHITSDGKVKIPNFRVSPVAKKMLFDWMAYEVKFQSFWLFHTHMTSAIALTQAQTSTPPTRFLELSLDQLLISPGRSVLPKLDPDCPPKSF